MRAQRAATAAAVLFAASSLVLPPAEGSHEHGDATSFVEVLAGPGQDNNRIFLSCQTNGGCCEEK
ncbi:MAG TPA: hypothetical protein DGG94_03425 [Micromonosporaceae bacterium]|nr:hypothetical protein [Micromonosporaceae bacterium]HCU48866.1 hypothetical protein [Micromonosporaceae bacterium]